MRWSPSRVRDVRLASLLELLGSLASHILYHRNSYSTTRKKWIRRKQPNFHRHDGPVSSGELAFAVAAKNGCALSPFTFINGSGVVNPL